MVAEAQRIVVQAVERHGIIIDACLLAVVEDEACQEIVPGAQHDGRNAICLGSSALVCQHGCEVVDVQQAGFAIVVVQHANGE